MKYENKYSSDFYGSVSSRAKIPAEIVSKFVSEVFTPKSIIDIGSGEGLWLATFLNDNPNATGVAVDLPGSNFSYLKSAYKSAQLLQLDFETDSLPNGQIFDLGICLEVIEHISEDRAHTLMDWISSSCKIVVFSGATIGQGGTHHINEQSQKYWIDSMTSKGFIPLDILRSRFKSRKSIPNYYSNNTFVYVNRLFLEDDGMLEILNKMSKFESLHFVDLRPPLLRIVQKCVSFLPRPVVSFLAEVKSKLIK
jgi:SAM-dependent methyltransferase